jgi:DnaJ-class molecular chaperone
MSDTDQPQYFVRTCPKCDGYGETEDAESCWYCDETGRIVVDAKGEIISEDATGYDPSTKYPEWRPE